MEINLILIDDLCQQAAAGRESFLQRYPGAFLMAMGYLDSEQMTREVLASTGRRAKVGGYQDSTVARSFGPRLRHNLAESHPLAGMAFFLRPTGDKPDALVGRSHDCDVTIPDSAVSERHCSLEVTERGVTVTDCGSTNGTSLNLRRLAPHEPAILADEDILSVGRYSFQLLAAQTLYRELLLLLSIEGYQKE